jgi:uncharacterized damage-inducible protein DinB
MTRTELLHLIDYHYWARDRMLAAVEALTADDFTKPLGNSFASIRDTVVHTYLAEWIWMQRWKGVSPGAAPDTSGYGDVASVRSAWQVLEAEVRAYVAGLEGERTNERIDYRNLAGVATNSSRWTMVQHVVNHASYHRGQVTTMMRQLGRNAPASQDLITYYREKGL